MEVFTNDLGNAKQSVLIELEKENGIAVFKTRDSIFKAFYNDLKPSLKSESIVQGYINFLNDGDYDLMDRIGDIYYLYNDSRITDKEQVEKIIKSNLRKDVK